MKRFVIVLAVLLIAAGCTTNGVYDSGKTWSLVGGLVVGGVIASNQADSNDGGSDCYIAIRSDGSSNQVCR